MIPCLNLRRSAVLALSLLLLSLTALSGAWGQDDGPTGTLVDILPIQGTIDRPASAAIIELLAEAPGRGVDLVVLQLDGRGGLAVDADAVLRAVSAAEVPVVVYIGPALARAEAGGLLGLLALAADVAAMAPDATIGPFLPVDVAYERPEADARMLEDGLLGAHFHQDTAPDGLALRLATETLTADQALDLGVIALQAGGLDGLLTDLDGVAIGGANGVTTLALRGDDVTLNLHSMGLVRRTLHASATPIFIYLMLVVGLALLLFELFQPGFGVAGIAALIVLLFAVYGLFAVPVAWWAVLLIIGGLGLLAADVAIAGLGIPTAAGTAALAVGSATLYPSPYLGVPGWLIALMVAACLVFFVVVLTIVLRAQAGPDVTGIDTLVGKVGVVRSALNPEGHAFIDGALWRARWTDPFDGKIPVGTEVHVHAVEGAVVLVQTHADANEPVAAAATEDA